MKFSRLFNKQISILLIISILAVNFSFITFPKKAEALFGIPSIPSALQEKIQQQIQEQIDKQSGSTGGGGGGGGGSSESGALSEAVQSGIDAVSDGLNPWNKIKDKIDKYVPEGAQYLIAGTGVLAGILCIAATISCGAAVAGSLNFLANSAKALGVDVHSVWDFTWNKVIVPVATGLMKYLARDIIRQITESTVDWIKGGFQGNPAFVSQPLKFLVNVADQTIGDMIFNDPALNFLCSPFQIQVKLALGLSFNTFKKKINCTLSQIIGNVQNAARGASVTVDVWTNWTETVGNPQNTPMGAYLIAQTELQARIGNKQEDLKTQLNQGFGALAYEECTGTRTPKGQFGPPEPYTFKGSRFYEEQSRDNNTYTYGTLKCESKTPGSVITSMLSTKANSDSVINQSVAALGQGLDTVLAALAVALIQKGMDQLTSGVLGDSDSPGNTNYNLTLASLPRTLQGSANSDVANVDNYGNGNMSNIFTIYDDVINSSGSVPFSQGFNDVSYTQENSVSTDPLESLRTNVIKGINYYLGVEATYQNTLASASTTLSSARAVFATARNCNAGYNTWPTSLRASLINSNVIQNIDGIQNTDSFRTLAQIPWNLTVIGNLLNISNSNISKLNTAQSAVNVASTEEDIIGALIPINSTSFNTDPLKDLVTNIDTWLRGVSDIYSTPECPIDLSKILTKTATSSSGYIFNTDLRVGSAGPDVVALQQILVDEGYLVMPAGVSLGTFGNLTRDAVIQFQLANHIDAILSATSPGAGIVGPYTRAFLNSRVTTTTTTATTTPATVSAPTGGITY